MKFHSRFSFYVEKVQLKVAALFLVLAGPAIAIFVAVQLWRGVLSAGGGSVPIESDTVTFYALNGMLMLVGGFAVTVSALTARHFLKRPQKKNDVRA